MGMGYTMSGSSDPKAAINGHPKLVDAEFNEVNVGDTIVTFRRANPTNYWFLRDLGILRKFVINEIYLMNCNDGQYLTWLSKPVMLKTGKEFVASGNTRKYKRLKYMLKHGAFSPWIMKINEDTPTMP